MLNFKRYFLLALLSVSPVLAQLNVKNHLEYTHWQDDDLQIWENWTDAAWQQQNWQLGVRYEINSPPDPYIFSQDSLVDDFDLTFAYAEYAAKNVNIRIGNFYEMFGRGLTLRTYENRSLRVDNNLFGGRVHYAKGNFNAKMIAGQMRDKYNRRDDMLYGIDAEQFLTDSWSAGLSFLSQQSSGAMAEQLYALRSQYSADLFDVYVEAAKPDWHDKVSYYAAVNFFAGDFTLTAEYKNYDHLKFANRYTQEYNAPPALTRQHTFTLLNRHPHALALNDEVGYQFELSWIPTWEWEFIFNHSLTETHAGHALFQQTYAEVHHYLGDGWESRLAAAYTFDFTTNTDNITAIIDETINISDRDQLHFGWQHQHTINNFDKSEYDTELVQIEYSHSPWGSFALVGEYTNQYKIHTIEMDRHTWMYGQLSLNFNNQELAILYGSRQEGFVCVGGICRYEPEFKGLEVRLISRF